MAFWVKQCHLCIVYETLVGHQDLNSSKMKTGWSNRDRKRRYYKYNMTAVGLNCISFFNTYLEPKETRHFVFPSKLLHVLIHLWLCSTNSKTSKLHIKCQRKYKLSVDLFTL